MSELEKALIHQAKRYYLDAELWAKTDVNNEVAIESAKEGGISVKEYLWDSFYLSYMNCSTLCDFVDLDCGLTDEGREALNVFRKDMFRLLDKAQAKRSPANLNTISN